MPTDAKDAPTIAQPRPWYRLHLATWLALTLAAGVLFLLEVPGRRTGPAEYSHGWPLAYMQRRPALGRSAFFYLLAADEAEAQQNWQGDGGPPEVEGQLNPWSFADAVKFEEVAIYTDSALAALVLIAVGWPVERRWRRRDPSIGRFFRFRLRTLFVVTTLFAIVCAVVSSWYHEYNTEQQICNQLGDDAGVTVVWTYQPPSWLPESLLKVGDLWQWFNRVYSVSLEDDKTTVAALNEVGVLTHLRYFEVARSNSTDGIDPNITPDATDALIERLAEHPNIETLNISSLPITPAGIKSLKKFRRLSELSIGGDGVNEESIEKLVGLTELQNLTLDSPSDARINLHGLQKLRSVWITCSDKQREIWLDALPQLESLTIYGSNTLPLAVAPPAVHFSGSPHLKTLILTNLVLDAPLSDLLDGSANLEVLSLDGIGPAKNVPFELRGMKSLKSLDLRAWSATEVRISDLPQLRSCTICGDDRVMSITLDSLPNLSDVGLIPDERLAAVELRETPNVRSLAVCGAISSTHSIRPRALTVRGLSGLTKINSLQLTEVKLDAKIVGDVSRLTSLTSLDLSNCNLDDDRLCHLKSLVNLEKIALNCCDVSDSAIDCLVDLPKLTALSLVHTAVSAQAVARLRTRRPNLDVAFDPTPRAIGMVQRPLAAVRNAQPTAAGDSNEERIEDMDLDALPDRKNVRGLIFYSSARLTDARIKGVERFVGLERLSLADSHVTDAGLEALRGLKHLEWLDLKNTLVAGTGLACLRDTTTLKRLILSDTDVTDDGLTIVAQLPSLEELWLSNTGISDAALAHLKNAKHLKRLHLDGCRIVGPGLKQLQGAPRLEELDLSGNRELRDDAIKNLAGLKDLATLDLRETPLTDAAVDGLLDLPKLRELSLIGTKVTDACIPTLKRLSSRENVHLDDTQITYEGLQSLKSGSPKTTNTTPTLVPRSP